MGHHNHPYLSGAGQPRVWLLSEMDRMPRPMVSSLREGSDTERRLDRYGYYEGKLSIVQHDTRAGSLAKDSGETNPFARPAVDRLGSAQSGVGRGRCPTGALLERHAAKDCAIAPCGLWHPPWVKKKVWCGGSNFGLWKRVVRMGGFLIDDKNVVGEHCVIYGTKTAMGWRATLDARPLYDLQYHIFIVTTVVTIWPQFAVTNWRLNVHIPNLFNRAWGEHCPVRDAVNPTSLLKVVNLWHFISVIPHKSDIRASHQARSDHFE